MDIRLGDKTQLRLQLKLDHAIAADQYLACPVTWRIYSDFRLDQSFRERCQRSEHFDDEAQSQCYSESDHPLIRQHRAWVSPFDRYPSRFRNCVLRNIAYQL